MKEVSRLGASESSRQRRTGLLLARSLVDASSSFAPADREKCREDAAALADVLATDDLPLVRMDAALLLAAPIQAGDGVVQRLAGDDDPDVSEAGFDALKARALALLSARAGRPVRSLSAGRAFLLGSLSKVVATLVTYPLIRTKVMMQAAAKGVQEGEPRPTMAQTLLKIIRTEGAAGLYRGCGAQIATAVSKSGILLMSKEQLARYALALILLLRSHKRSKMIATAGLAPSA